MAEHFRFFNSTVGDTREYQASEFAEYFSRFLTDGIYSQDGTMDLKVTITSGLDISVATGFGFIRGYLYKNDTAISLTLDSADTVLHRIDRVVLKLDTTSRIMGVEVKKGTLASEPVAPTLTDDVDVKEISLARIRVNANANTGVITDERTPVSSLIDIPFEDMSIEFDAWFAQTESDYDTWFSAKQSSSGNELYTGDVEPSTIAEGDIWFRDVV